MIGWLRSVLAHPALDADRPWPGRAAVVVLLWLSRMILPGDIAYDELDWSWCRGLGYAVAHGWQAGVDTVFTFGPLGFFATGVYVPELHRTQIRFAIAPGARRLRGRFGLLPDASRRSATGGSTFRAVLRAPGSREEILWERSLDPARAFGDRGLQSLDVRFDVRAPASLLLRTDAGPRRSPGREGTVWAAILVE